jgi:hypothetical protein
VKNWALLPKFRSQRPAAGRASGHGAPSPVRLIRSGRPARVPN